MHSIFSNRRHMFSRAAAECGLTVDQYSRIAFHASVGLPHMQQDLSIVDCQFVGENYRRSVTFELLTYISSIY